MRIIYRLKLIFTVHRDLLFHLALKNLKIQYKYAFLGFLWAFFVPLCMALVFWFIFSFLFRRPTPPLSIVTALFVWQFISMSISGATSSIIDNAAILKKIYFPREIVPISIVFSNFINFLLSLVVLFLFIFVYNVFMGVRPIFPLTVVFLPAVIFITLLLTTGLVLLTSHLQVFFRDVRYIVEIILLLWFYLSGVFYDVGLVAGRGIPALTKAFMLNPIYDIFSMYRIILLNDNTTQAYYPTSLMVLQTITISAIVFFLSYLYFLKREKELVDLI